jgi:hypothetical protein
MKNIFLLYTIIFYQGLLNSQTLMKVREIYDFQIGDEFQYKSTFNGQSYPNADRIIVMDKLISANNDTIAYTYFHKSYTSVYNSIKQKLDYSFTEYKSKETITNLDSMISFNLHPDSSRLLTIYFDTLCDLMIDGFYLKDKRSFESSSNRYEYGKGLGIIKKEEFDGQTPGRLVTSMFYFNKQGKKCGIPDLTTNVIETKFNLIKVYPNPTHDFLIIEMSDKNTVIYSITDITGKTILSKYEEKEKIKIDMFGLPAGIYNLQVNDGKNIFKQKIVKQ